MEREIADRQLLARVAAALAAREEILEAYVFGSRARGHARPDSDIDVAVYVDETRARGGIWGYRAELATALMTALGTDDVDVVVLNRAPILLYHRVLRDGARVLSRDLRATTTRAGRALSRYFDFLPQLDKMDAARRHAADSRHERRPEFVMAQRPPSAASHRYTPRTLSGNHCS